MTEITWVLIGIAFVFGYAFGNHFTRKMFIWDLKYKGKTGQRMCEGGYFFEIKTLGKVND